MTHHKAPVLACEGSMKSDPCQYRSMVRDSCRGGEKGELKCSANAEGTALLPLPGIKVGHARLAMPWMTLQPSLHKNRARIRVW